MIYEVVLSDGLLPEEQIKSNIRFIRKLRGVLF